MMRETLAYLEEEGEGEDMARLGPWQEDGAKIISQKSQLKIHHSVLQILREIRINISQHGFL